MNRPLSDYAAFRFRLRHDRLLRLRLRHARHQVEIELARELGFSITLDDLRGGRGSKAFGGEQDGNGG